MTRRLPMEWHYAIMKDVGARLGPDTTLVIRVEDQDYTILGIFPGQELADKFLEVLAAAPHESLWSSLSATPANPSAPLSSP